LEAVKRPQFFADPGTDRLYEVMLNIVQEMWVQEERLLALEGKTLDDAERDARAKAMIDRLFAPLRES
jgi:hypothetical protein